MKKRKEEKETLKKIQKTLVRYLILLIIGIIFFLSPLLYNFLSSLTIHSSSFLLNLFYSNTILENQLFFSDHIIMLIPACVATSAYLLLIILNLTTPIKIKKRISLLITSLLTFFILNITRILLLSLLFLNNSSYFSSLHQFSWYFLSTIMVVGIWFILAHIFKIKTIPVYTDIKTLLNLIKK